jgi:hypothetical protein
LVVFDQQASVDTVLRVADLTGDGKPDILMPCESPEHEGCGLKLSVQLADGTFAQPVELGSYGHALYLDALVGDIDGDGNADVAVAWSEPLPAASTASEDRRLQVLRFRGGTFKALPVHKLGADERLSGLIDIDADGTYELAVLGEAAVSLLAVMAGKLVERERVNLKLDNSDPSLPLDFVSGASVADFEGSGSPLLLVELAQSPVQAFELRAGKFVARPEYDAYRAPVYADFDGDGATDYAWVEPNQVRPELWLGISKRDGSFTPHKSVVLPYASGVAAADLDGDGVQDLFLPHEKRRMSIVFGRGDGELAAPRTFKLDVELQWYALIDIDQDGQLDLLNQRTLDDTGHVQLSVVPGACL